MFRMEGFMVIEFEAHRRPPADNLFCCVGTACDPREAAVRPAISMKERDSFAEHFADSFAEAMSETRADQRKRDKNAA